MILWETFVVGKSVPGYASVIVGVMVLGGMQLVMIGVVGEYIGKIIYELKARPVYFVAEKTSRRAGSDEMQTDLPLADLPQPGPSRTAAE
jgi:polyisoprenyl-phosphate glycosyltransferase